MNQNISVDDCIKLINEGNIYLPNSANTVYLAEFLIPYNYTRKDVNTMFEKLQYNKASLLMLPYKSIHRFLTFEQKVKVLNTGFFDLEDVFYIKEISSRLILDIKDGVYGEVTQNFLDRVNSKK